MSRTLNPSTPLASAAAAQSRGDSSMPELPVDAESLGPGAGSLFTIGPRVFGAVLTKPYERRPADPIYRPLRIYSLDPSVSRLDGGVALVNVPYEPLARGPQGSVFDVVDFDSSEDLRYRSVDLEDPAVLIRNGHSPSPSDPMFHQQMVYAVCSLVYAAFKSALGRHIAWAFDGNAEEASRLVVRPHAYRDTNAYYDKEHSEICFGYYRAGEAVSGNNLPGGYFFTCLSHDVIAHEVTHALLDGLRAHFVYPSSPDVLAFHEAFADLVALFQHFSFKEVLLNAIGRSRGNLAQAELLTDLARQFGQTTRTAGSLRTVVDPEHASYNQAGIEPHARGSVLTAAVFEAYETVFARKTARYIRLATGGSGVLPPGEMSPDLQQILAKEASELASQFLSICIRAVDYCPPVDLQFGEFLRAAVTADFDLVPDDPWGYREAWIEAFRRREIFPNHVPNLSEDALLWRPALRPLGELKSLSFAELAFSGDPGRPASARELCRQAGEIGRFVSKPENLEVFGLARAGDPRLRGDVIEPPRVESIRSSRRAGPDGQIIFDLVAEVTQRRTVRSGNGQGTFDFYGGSTIILGPSGEFRYVISKSVLNEDRLEKQRTFIRGEDGRRFWTSSDGVLLPRKQLFKMMHGDESQLDAMH